MSLRNILFAVFSIPLLTQPSCTRLEDNTSKISDAVTEFYMIHFKNDMGFTEESIVQKKAWFTPDLFQVLLEELRKPADPDLVPTIDGDPFTDTQEYPASFKVGPVTVDNGRADVVVYFSSANPDRIVHVVLKKEGGDWLIDDFLYDNGETLRQILLESL
jgi:hypothetical protein